MAYQIILITLSALLQNTGAFNFWGVTPNLVLAALVPLAFLIKDWREYFLLVLIAGLLLSIQPFWNWPVIALVGLLILIRLIKNYLPWQPFFSILLLLILVTIIVDLPVFIPLEIIFNLILGIIIYEAKTKF